MKVHILGVFWNLLTAGIQELLRWFSRFFAFFVFFSSSMSSHNVNDFTVRHPRNWQHWKTHWHFFSFTPPPPHPNITGVNQFSAHVVMRARCNISFPLVIRCTVVLFTFKLVICNGQLVSGTISSLSRSYRVLTQSQICCVKHYFTGHHPFGGFCLRTKTP